MTRVTPNGWREWPAASTLSWPPDTIQVVAFSLAAGEGQTDTAAMMLSRAERARARRFVRAVDNRRYIMAHATLRQILSGVVRCTPRELVFERSAAGRPYLTGAGSALEFSLAHSEDVGILAISTRRRVGIDLEHHQDRIEWRAVARQFLSTDDWRTLEDVGPETQLPEFFDAWTRREATLKLLGASLTHAPSSLRSGPSLWTDSLPAGPGLSGAVASVQPRAPLRLNRWELT